MRRLFFSLCVLLFCGALGAAAAPLKVYILTGQSNMEGHARISTFEALAQDPVTAPILKDIRAADGSPRTCERVWISYYTGGRDNMGEGFGKLSAGFGARSDPAEASDKIGPEFGFGIYMEKALADEPILIIKAAWGGKSIHTDFRPPSAGPYPFNEKELENLKKQGKDIAAAKAEKGERTGHYYRLMMGHVKHVLSDIKRVYPAYAGQGYEIAGLVWFQGWNDMVASGTYPGRGKPGGYDAYSECLAHFIRDVRKELSAPDMKVVIGVMGVGGPIESYTSQRYVPIHRGFREAMAAPAALPEFAGNVTAVDTAQFWDMRLKAIEEKQNTLRQLANFLKSKHKDHANHDGSMDAKAQKAFVEAKRCELISEDDEAYAAMARSNAGFHYYGSAKTMAQIGKAFAEAMLKLQGE